MGISCLLASEARPRRQAQLVVEASGSSEGFEMAMEFVRPRGTIVLKSTLAGGAKLNLCPIVIHEITVLGSRCGPFSDALAALAGGTVDTEGLITAEFPLSEGCRAMEAAQHSDALKVVVRP
ncbi:MAG: hypothetical protein GWP05_11065 [Anaerolineaceae bacterium]|nr:hypothetical protein [Anaerolineaceae bacterium]